MASSQKRRKFTFTWQIQNFNICPHKFKEVLKSPVFQIKMLEGSEWQLELYPKGSDSENVVSCYLRCKSVGTSNHVSNLLIYSFVLSRHATKDLKNETFNKARGWGFPILIFSNAVLWNKNDDLPDTLIIKCTIWQYSDGKKDPFKNELKSEDLAGFTKYVKDSALWDKCTVVTRVQVQRKSFFWPIANFSSINSTEKLVICVPSVLENVPTLYIKFNKSTANRSADIQIRKGCDFSEDVFVKCQVSVMHTRRGVRILAEGHHLFESGVEDIWKYPSFLKFDTLEEDEYFNQTCDVLHLHFEFSFSKLQDIHHTENVLVSSNETLLSNSHSIKEFGLLYNSEKLTDVTIEAGDRVFKAHKIILTARSPVFGALIDEDLKKKGTGSIYLPDVDPDIMDKMLSFMYTNVIGDLLPEEAFKLYSVAYKYQVLSLKARCAWILASFISVHNVCKVLTLADRHNDEYLRDRAEVFIQVNSALIFKSRDWRNLIQSSGTLAAKVMHKMLSK